MADFFADKDTMKHLARLLGLRLNRALAEQPDGGRSSRVLSAAECYGVRTPNRSLDVFLFIMRYFSLVLLIMQPE